MSVFNEVPCDKVAEEVRVRFQETRAGLAVYWVAVESSRNDYAQQLQAMLCDHAVAVVVLRSRGLFENANSVMADIVSLIDEAKVAMEQAFGAPWLAKMGGGRRSTHSDDNWTEFFAGGVACMVS